MTLTGGMTAEGKTLQEMNCARSRVWFTDLGYTQAATITVIWTERDGLCERPGRSGADVDAGLAAIIGATVGAAGTALASALAYRGTLLTAREQTAAEASQWRRTHRRETYITMIDAAQNHFRLTESWYDTHYRQPEQQGLPAPPRRVMEWSLEEQGHGGDALNRATIAVQLEGPRHLYELALDLNDKNRNYAQICLHHLAHKASLEEVTTALRARNTALEEFAAAARDQIHDQ